MADENEETQSQESAESTQTENETQTEVQVEDWESKYKAEQAERQKVVEAHERDRETLDLLMPYVDWSKVQQPAESEGGERQEVTQDDLKKALGAVDTKLLLVDFRISHPELRDYEDNLIAPTVRRIKAENPRLSGTKLLERAAKEVKDFLESERSKGRQEVEKRKASAAATGGMGSAGTTSTKKKEEEESKGETNEEYIARRQKESAKARGLIV